MGRKVRILQMPLRPLQALNVANPLLSHWGLLIGENDLLLEIFPIAGSSRLLPLNELRISRWVNLQARQATFKFGIFPQTDTEKSDEEIIKAGNDIICRNPYYNIATYNCQNFVNDLAEAIAAPCILNNLKRGVRKWLPWLARPIMYRGDGDETTESIDLAQEAVAEVKYLMEHGQRLRDGEETAKDVEYKIPNINDDDKGPKEPMELKPFSPKDQVYLLTDQGDDLVSGGYGLVYGLTEDPAFKLADIPVPANPRSLLPDQKTKLDIAEALVGQEQEVNST